MALYSERCRNGHLLTEGFNFCSVCGIPADNWTCSQGHTNGSDATTCSICGSPRREKVGVELKSRSDAISDSSQNTAPLTHATALRVPTSNWRRFWAHLIDLVLTLIFGSLSGGLLGLGYLIWAGWMQGVGRQSIGYMLTGQYLVSSKDGEVIGGGAGVGRTFLHLLDGIPLLAGYVVGLITGQTFADRMVSSRVVREGK